jgi:uncharacterized protein YfaS (alpha-2-macroglobulin family)
MKKTIFCLMILACFSCQKTAPEYSTSPAVAKKLETRLDLEQEILQGPPSLISMSSNLDIVFREDMVISAVAGQILRENPFDFEPTVKGKAQWISASQLHFQPDSPWPAGQAFKVTLDGKKLFGKQQNIKNASFKFRVAEQEIISADGDFEAVMGQKNQVRYKGILTYAQAVKIEKVQKDLSLKGPAGKIRISIKTGDSPEKIIVTSDPVQRTSRGQTFTLSLPGEYTVSDSKWEKLFYLPAIGVFRVLGHMDMTDPEADKPSYGFRFSDPLRTDTDLSAFVTIEPAMEYNVRVDQKYLIVSGLFDVGTAYHVTINKNFPSAYGTKLGEDFIAELTFSNIKPEIKWLSEGIYLPSSNQYKLQLKSVNVARARIRIFEIFSQNIAFFLQSNDLISSNRRQYYYSDELNDLNRVGKEIYNKQHPLTDTRNRWIKTELDLSEVFKKATNSVFVIYVQFDKDDLTGKCTNSRDDLEPDDLYFEDDDYYSNPCDYGYYYENGTQSKILISSNIGLTIKKADDGIHVFATNVLSAQPAEGLELNMISYVNEKIETQRTDGEGHAFFKKEGFYIYGQGLGIVLMKLNEHPWQINNFDVSGANNSQNGTDVFMYTERGVHRPGDTVYLSAIIRMNRKLPSPRQPVLLEVKNPQGREVLNLKNEAGPNGHVVFEIPTNLDDPTGNWQAVMKVGDQEFTKTLKIETVKPNRLKVQIEAPDSVVSPQIIHGVVTSKYLFGAPAADLQTVIRATIRPLTFTCKEYSEYTFSTPNRHYDVNTDIVADGSLDSQGQMPFQYEASPYEAPSVLGITFNAAVSEKGGSFVEASSFTTFYPYDSNVGIRIPANMDRSLKTGTTVELPVLVISTGRKPIAGHALQVTLYLNRSHWWYDYDNRDQQDFRSMSSTYQISQTTLVSEKNPVSIPLKAEDRGQHYLEVEDLESGHVAGFFFYASPWADEVPPDKEKERNTLVITGDRKTYRIGDQAVLTFDTPDKSLVLFTLEQGTRLLDQRWIRANAGKTSVRFDITETMIPNCYAALSVQQPHAQTANDLPMRVYGVKTLYVENENTHLPLSMTVPDELRPNEKFKVSVTSKSKEASCTIAIIDEGLLDLTRFATPDPWQHYFQKIRLAVETCDNYDEIIGVLFPDIDKYISIGGGDEEAHEKRLGTVKVQRFKPVVLFQKPVTVPAGKTKSFEFTMPNYVGAVRVMVVGASGHSYASIEKSVPVKKPLMILPTLPRVARPGDTFALPVSVFAMDPKIRHADVMVTVSDNLRVNGLDRQPVFFEKAGEKDIAFSISAGPATGAGKVTVKASSAGEKTDEVTDIPIDSANPFYTEAADTVIAKGESCALIPAPFGIEGTNHAKLAFSRIPDIQMGKRFNDLIQYPYGCIEQMISAALPQLYLPHLADMKPYQKQNATDHINLAMQKLAQFKLSSGFAYWPDSPNFKAQYSEWGTNYIGFFLIHAKALGYHVPDNLYDHWLADAKGKAGKVNPKDHRYQTCRLFLLALAGEPQIGAMNLVRENYLTDLDVLSRKLLGAAYSLSGQKNVAVEIDRAVPTEITHYRELGETYGSDLRDRALLAYLCVKMDDLKTASPLLRSLAREFRPWGWYSTQETAMTILALGTYHEASPFTGGGVKFSLKMENQKPEAMELTGYQKVIDIDNQWNRKIIVQNESANPLFVTLFTEGIPLESRIKTEHSGIQLTRNFYDEDGRPITVDSRESGQPFWVIYTVESLYRQRLENLALSSVFPTGWEIINFRMTGEPFPGWIQRMGLSDGDFMDIRDDRINWFFGLPTSGKVVLGTKINPSFRGDYVLPPVTVEAMYSPEYYARIQGGRVKVE